MNFDFSIQIISSLIKWGVQEFYICAGARNIPLIEILMQSNENNIFSHFEERSASFYALGRIKSIKKPVAIIVTSGTAAGELLPAVMESYYSSLPLVIVTSDRPKKYRGTGAPQTAEQKNLYGSYVSACIDIEAHDEFDIDFLPRNLPLHINACFDIPLQSKKIIDFKNVFDFKNIKFNSFIFESNNFNSDINLLLDFLNNSKNVLVIVSKVNEDEMNAITPFLLLLNFPVYLESISNLRECELLNKIKILSPDKIWKNCEKSCYLIDSILKIGSTPTHRIWRDLDELKSEIKILSISSNSFSGSYRAKNITTNINLFLDKNREILNHSFKRKCDLNILNQFLSYDKIDYLKMHELFNKYPLAEQSVIHHISKEIPNNSRVYLGNSLPIRTWDMAAIYENKNFLIEASRGLNGIDGQVSTFLGFADSSTENWAILGDLTTLYDLAGLWAIQYKPSLNLNIIIINNGGGLIFKGVLSGNAAKFCQNSHAIHFKHWADMWGLEYEFRNENLNELNLKKNHFNKNIKRIIEIIPDADETSQFSIDYNKI